MQFVDYDTSTYADPPARFEAGTPPFLQISGLGAALCFIEEIGWPAIQAHEEQVGAALRSVLSGLPAGLHLFSAACPTAPPVEASSPTSLSKSGCRSSCIDAVSGPQHRKTEWQPTPPRIQVDNVGSLAKKQSQEPAHIGIPPPIPLVAFAHPRVHAHDLAMFLDVYGSVCVRSGHHCCQPLHRRVLGVPATCRASLALYNTVDEVDR